MIRPGIPCYDQLPVVEGAPPWPSWGRWGPEDVSGCLRLIGAAQTLSGTPCAQRGDVFNLNLEMELPDPPFFGRERFVHRVVDLERIGHEDSLDGWNTQTSLRWDGFRHIKLEADPPNASQQVSGN